MDRPRSEIRAGWGIPIRVEALENDADISDARDRARAVQLRWVLTTFVAALVTIVGALTVQLITR